MKEYPILFSKPMARAIREGRKTQTRRVIKERHLWKWTGLDEHMMDLLSMCPYGKPGDRLMFLTGWATEQKYDGTKPILLPESASIWTRFDSDTKPDWCGRLRMGRHLPKWARKRRPDSERGVVVSRRVERVEDISEEDAIAEGFSESFDSAGGCHERTTACENFLYTFYDLNERAPRGSNPWVWVVEFRRAK